MLAYKCTSNLHNVSSAGSEVISPAALLTTQQYIPSSAFVTLKIVRVPDVALGMSLSFFFPLKGVIVSGNGFYRNSECN